MTIKEKTINWILSLLTILLIAVFFTADSKASGTPHEHHNGTNGINGADGMDGSNGVNGINGRNGSDGLNGLSYNNAVFNRAIAITGAMSAIPSPSHTHKDHGHTMAGVGGGGYAGESSLAIGVVHQQGQISGKATLGVSGSEAIYGIGAGFTF